MNYRHPDEVPTLEIPPAKNRMGMLRHIKQRDKKSLTMLTALRISLSLLDLAGLGVIALIASLASQLAFGGAASVQVGSFGVVDAGEREIVLLGLFAVMFFVVKSGLSVWLSALTARKVAEIETSLSMEISQGYFLNLDLGESHETKASELKNMMLESMSAFSEYINGRIGFISEFSLLVLTSVIFLLVNPIAAATLFGFFILLVTLMNAYLKPRIVGASEKQVEGYLESLEISGDLFQIRKEVIANGEIEDWLGVLGKSRQKTSDGRASVFVYSGLPRHILETALLLGFLVFMSGLILLSDAQSQLVSIGIFLAGGLRVVSSLLPTQNFFNMMREGGTKALPALLFLDKAGSRNNRRGPILLYDKADDPVISFQNVFQKYPNSKGWTLQDLSFEIYRGEMTALVGPSGAGKTTVAEIVCGITKVDSGQLIEAFSNPSLPTSLKKKTSTALVPQSPQLINGTLADNILLNPTSTFDEALAAEVLTKVGLGKLCASPEWWTRKITPDFGELSGGEIQRLSIARALYRKPDVLVLDEPTSALDFHNEKIVTNILAKEKKNLAIVVVAHRLTSIRAADNLIYLENGKIVAQGTYEELQDKVANFRDASTGFGG